MRRAQSPPSRSTHRHRDVSGRSTNEDAGPGLHILVSAPFRRDEDFICEALRGNLGDDVDVGTFAGAEDLEGVDQKRHAFVLTQEALTQRFVEGFNDWLEGRPDWLQIPVLLVLDEALAARQTVEELRQRMPGADLTFLYRPLYLATFRSSARNAIAILRQGQSVVRLLNLERELRSEIDHRMKNQLATVLALYHLTRKQSSSFEEFDQIFSRRIKSLSDVHELLRRQPSKAIPFFELCRTVLAPYQQAEAGHVELTGPNFDASTDAALTLSLLLNELATNAAKYGALSVPAGKLALTTEEQDGEFKIVWEESDGPEVKAPTSTSYGTAFVRSAAGMLGGSAKLDYRGTGFVAEILVSANKVSPTGP